jgi:hypothetical protein
MHLMSEYASVFFGYHQFYLYLALNRLFLEAFGCQEDPFH